MVRSSSLLVVALLAVASAHAQFGTSYPMFVEGPAMGELVDMDGDGDIDLLLGTRSGPLVYTNHDGLGNFQYPEAAFGIDHAVAHGVDLNGDGLTDVVGARQGQEPGIDVFRNSLQDGHTLYSSISSTLSASALASGDLDQDGDQDVVLGLSNGQLSVAWNDDGQGHFSGLEVVVGSGTYSRMRILDMDADGDLDITWSNDQTGNNYLVRRQGTGFTVPQLIGNDGPGILADLNSDGLPDLVCATGSGDILWRQNLGGGTFSGTTLGVADLPLPAGRLVAGDVDSDGDQDVIWSSEQPHAIQWAENTTGTGVFGPVQNVLYLQGATSDLACADINGDSSTDLLQVGTSMNQVVWMAGVIVPGGRLVGRVFNDLNGDGLFNGGDHGLRNVPVEVQGGPTTWTNAAGLYWFDLPAGTYTVETAASPVWDPTTPLTRTATVSMMGTTTGIDFGREAAGAQPAVGTSMYGAITVCNYASSFWAMVENTGNVAGDLHLSVTLDQLVTLAGADPQPDSVVDDVAHWTFAQVAPGHARTVTVGAQMPGVLNMGDTLHNVADAELRITGTVVATAQALHEPVLLSSYDPNDKQVMPAGEDLAHLTAFGERMVYAIRFQNTGNYRAETVVLVDTLDADLDPASLALVASSHPCRVELVDGVLRFVFEGIMLPDSTSDPLGSQGFVRFAIDHSEGLPEGTLLTNTAHIFFDLNPAIITNTVFNTLTSDLVGVEEVATLPDPGVRLVPNPAVNEVEVRLEEAPGAAYQVFLYDAAGRAVRFWQVAPGIDRLRMPLGGVEPGTYVARVRTMDGGYDRTARLVVAR